MLTLVATPIGNLEDISQRALQTLRDSDFILAEDTRRSAVLLERYGIRKRLLSYHSFKEKQVLKKILNDLKAGMRIALISDAGTPCINDPGSFLVQACIEQGLPFTAIPGPCSIIQALVLSGMDTEKFQFIGFLPKKADQVLRQAFGYPGTTVALESPGRLVATLDAACKIDPKRKVAVLREMTKVFEECRRGNPVELLEHFNNVPPRGEIVLVIAGGTVEGAMPLEELVEMLQTLYGLSLKEAIKRAAKLQHIPKRSVYEKMHP